MGVSQLIQNEFKRHQKNVITFGSSCGNDQILSGLASELKKYGTSYNVNGLITVTGWNTCENGEFYFISNAIDRNLRLIRTTFGEEAHTALHRHDFIELLYVEKGRSRLRIQGRDEEFKAGDICLIDMDSIHEEYVLREEATIVYLNIETSFLGGSMNAGEGDTNTQKFIKEIILKRKEKYKFVRFQPKRAKTSVPKIIENIFQETINPKLGSFNLTKGYTERLISLLPIEYNIILSKEEKEKMSNALCSDVCKYIDDHYDTVTVQSLAEFFNYTPEHITRLMKQYSGKSCSKYIQEKRLEKASELLITTRFPVEDIARIVGYTNVGFFYLIFQKKYGRNPGEAR